MVAVSGDRTYLGSIDAVISVFGVLSNGTTNLVPGSMELSDNVPGSTPKVNIVLNAVEGDVGDQGESSQIVDMQYNSPITSASELPSGLTEDDEGLAYWIGNVVFVWSGSDWFGYPLGVPGPPGAYPVFSVSADLIPSNTLESLSTPINIVHNDLGKLPGNPENPVLHFQFDEDSILGDPGPYNGPLRDSVQYDNSITPNDGDAIVFNALTQLFQPSAFSQLTIPVYSVPEGSFTSIKNSTGSNITICTFPVPPQNFPWRPLVVGVVLTEEVGYFNLFSSPVNVGCNVELGDPLSGTLVGRGFGNNSGWSYIMPHYSTPGNPYQAINPGNDIAVVPANHLGNQGTLYVTLTNDSGLGLSYSFNATNAQLLVACIPAYPYVPTIGGQSIHLLAGKGQLSCSASIYEGS